MRIQNLLIGVTIFLMLACQFVFGQKNAKIIPSGKGKIITEEEFGALTYQSQLKLESQNYQIKTVEEIFSGSKNVADEINVTVNEADRATDSRRIVKETKNSKGDISKTGFMMIGKNRYRIDTNGQWILDPRSGWGRGSGSGSGAGDDTKPVPQIFRFIGKSVLDGKSVLLYEVSGEHRGYFRERFFKANEFTRYWFSADGKLLKQEKTEEYPDLKLRVKTLVINKFNAVVKIQAPQS